jgi:AAA+ ATPase superfamily predicted ATPase
MSSEQRNMRIVGREYEQKKLELGFQSKEAEFIVVYGRRRVGKTYLIRRFFEQKQALFFQVSGIHRARSRVQLNEFKKEIERVFYATKKSTRLQNPTNWMEALGALTDAIENTVQHQKVVLFFDEFPWMATPKSGLLQAIDYYWNRFWVNNPNIKVVICGSAAAWIIDKILSDKGGLYNRVTSRIHLHPFTLKETKTYLEYKGVYLDNAQILQLYLCIGGIPFYLKHIQKGYSAIQSINQLCFQKKGTLLDEFENLFTSLFDQDGEHEAIIKLIASKREGVSRSEIEKAINIKGGRLTKWLKELAASDFISELMSDDKERGQYFKVTDEYTLFYLSWIDKGSVNRIKQEMTENYWEAISQKPAWKAWSGYAFEAVCFKHLPQIRKAVSIPEGSIASSWRYISNKTSDMAGAQIDLIFNRNDGIINIFEIKCSFSPYALEKAYSAELQRKIEVYKKITKTEKQIFLCMITANRLKKTLYSEEYVSAEVTLKDFYY